VKDEISAIGIADFIRARSSAGHLTGLADLETAWNRPGSDHSVRPEQIPVQDITLRDDDIKAARDAHGHLFYYSERFMTGTYAKVLVLKGEGSLRMMSEVIREHSRIYLRPVPVVLFQCSPFDLKEDMIAVQLEEMTQKNLYRDIDRIITSAGNLFLYSTDHLDRDHAVMLAEWIDVGQAENP
jgi:hypothetical protein